MLRRPRGETDETRTRERTGNARQADEAAGRHRPDCLSPDDEGDQVERGGEESRRVQGMDHRGLRRPDADDEEAGRGGRQAIRPAEEAVMILQTVPYKGSLPTAVPTDPLIYRFYELVNVYG